MRRTYSYKTEALALSSSDIGSISKCRCCDFYHLSIGNITLRLTRVDLMKLAEMLVEALELGVVYDFSEGKVIS
ncbi:hypothetical protein HRbin37_00873 [bacterium HR37]|nr:hypothetical protein HRbin37_00873 [bacterium HR37]